MQANGIEKLAREDRFRADRAVFLTDDTGSIHGPGQAATAIDKSGSNFYGPLIGIPFDTLSFFEADRANRSGRAKISTGDYFCVIAGSPDQKPRRIIANTTRSLELDRGLPFEQPPETQHSVSIQIRLQQPYVDPKLCIGCGVCEHECPVRGKRAIRVTAENESRARQHALILQG